MFKIGTEGKPTGTKEFFLGLSRDSAEPGFLRRLSAGHPGLSAMTAAPALLACSLRAGIFMTIITRAVKNS